MQEYNAYWLKIEKSEKEKAKSKEKKTRSKKPPGRTIVPNLKNKGKLS